MLVTREKACAIVKDCRFAGSSRANGYSGKNLVDVRTYSGSRGSGYTITGGGVKTYWIYTSCKINSNVYEGGYNLGEAVATAEAVKAVDWHGVAVTPCWELELDVIDGSYNFHRTDEYKPITLGGRTLTVCWLGSKEEKFLRAKIRRKMRQALNNGKAVLV